MVEDKSGNEVFLSLMTRKNANEGGVVVVGRMFSFPIYSTDGTRGVCGGWFSPQQTQARG